MLFGFVCLAAPSFLYEVPVALGSSSNPFSEGNWEPESYPQGDCTAWSWVKLQSKISLWLLKNPFLEFVWCVFRKFFYDWLEFIIDKSLLSFQKKATQKRAKHVIGVCVAMEIIEWKVYFLLHLLIDHLLCVSWRFRIRNAGDLNNELMLGIFCKVLSLFLKLGKQQLSEYFFIHVLFCNHQPV